MTPKPSFSAVMRTKPGLVDRREIRYLGSFPSGGRGGPLHIATVQVVLPTVTITRLLTFDSSGNLVNPRESGAYESYVDKYVEHVRPDTSLLSRGEPL